jgi:hypothetical protein
LRYEEIANKRGVAVGSVVFTEARITGNATTASRKIVERNDPVFAMNSMNDQSFFDLAMKVIARQATDAERANLDALLAQGPELRAEFARLETDARVAKDALPLISACTASAGEFPVYARERLQTAVRQTLGRPNCGKRAASQSGSGWRWGWARRVRQQLFCSLPSVRHSPNKLETA